LLISIASLAFNVLKFNALLNTKEIEKMALALRPAKKYPGFGSSSNVPGLKYLSIRFW